VKNPSGDPHFNTR